MYFAEKFPGVHFEYKLSKKVLNSEDYLNKRGFIVRMLRKMCKNLKRSILFWR